VEQANILALAVDDDPMRILDYLRTEADAFAEPVSGTSMRANFSRTLIYPQFAGA
jgi:hypothetical protein